MVLVLILVVRLPGQIPGKIFLIFMRACTMQTLSATLCNTCNHCMIDRFFFCGARSAPEKIKVLAFFPTCQVRASRFYRVTCSSSSSSSSDLLRLLPTANSRSRWALPGLNRKLQISVGTRRSGRLWSGPGPRAQEAVEWPWTGAAYRPQDTMEWPWTRTHVR